ALDSGPGFDPALLDSVLDPFFTTKDGGTGLGLPIVSSIINSHGGEIQLANGPEGGALVRILLPAAEPEQPEAPEAPAAAAEAQPAPEESGEAAVRAADDRENGTPEPRKES
ncbi:MAG: ATP-binding protein, partial [Desulfovibrio sp.]